MGEHDQTSRFVGDAQAARKPNGWDAHFSGGFYNIALIVPMCPLCHRALPVSLRGTSSALLAKQKIHSTTNGFPPN
ncbi:MAG TPA: hypothetical protein VNZ94_03890 [Xanthobacteraceae bacterium]|nr:hypothetical protein [Xanthobacteraceae bacterium]